MGFIAPIMSAVGTGISAIGQVSAGNAAMQTARTNADIITERAAIAESEQRQQDRTILARAHALVGASGVELTGSPLDVMAESARQAELNALYIRRGGVLDAHAQLVAGANARRASNISAASTILTGASTVGQQVTDLNNTRTSNASASYGM